MAEVALGAFLQVLFDNIFKKIGSLIANEVRLLEDLTEDLEQLESTVRKFQHVLRAAEMMNFKSPETRDWYQRLLCVANKADGVLDEALDCLEPYVDRDKPVCHPFTCFIFNHLAIHRRNLGGKIKSVTRKFINLDDEGSKLNFEQINIKRETVSTLSEVVFGREEEKEMIITTLLSNANTETCPPPFIYAIVGLGGIGKTTLAQLIYNDEKVVKEFDTRIWVWVSQTFDVKLVMEKIIETLSKEACKFESLETTQSRLNELLKRKKFLLVLDDIWNENQVEWNKLKSSLKFGAIGSSVLLTTRGSDVASIARVHDQHKIAVLSEDQCWHVFKESAFLENGLLEVIGKQIAKKCGGLPLAAKSLGGSLRLTREVHEWKFVRDSRIWELPQPGDILPALKLSLDSLESHSRNCFTFCCVFPKGYEMKKEEVIQLWMANDLIPTHPRLELEDLGNKIFNDLVLKSFFQVSSEDYDVKMHDLMHDLGLSFRNDCFCLQSPDVPDNIPPQCLHLSISSSYPSKLDILETLSKSHPSLRTCIFRIYGEEINFTNLDCLRALFLSDTKMEDLPVSVWKIKDLKYLNICDSLYFTHLPDSICTMTKLQTLKLRGCRSLTQMPNGITQLVSLRLLDLCGCEELTHLPDGVTQLINLRQLDLGYCSNLTHLPDEIGKLINLRHLNLSYCSSLTHLPVGIGRLMNLGYLNLSGCDDLIHLPDDITELVNLQHLLLCYCLGLTHLPDEIGKLTNLRHLDLRACDELNRLPDGISQLINLELLDISSSSVTQLPNGMGQLVNLRMLTWFSVGIESGQRITELQGLNHLRGSLEIRGLEHVRDAREAEAAILKNKKNLSSLELIWGDLQGSNNSNVEVEGVLEALQPPQGLNKKLVIEGYGGSVFASWMKLLENLVEIELRDCIKCERLPSLGQLPLLKLLTITGMKSLKSIGTEFYGSSVKSSSSSSSSERCTTFPSLEELLFEDMLILEEWQDTEVKDNQQTDPCLCLKRLTLRHCPKLTSLPPLILSFVQKLEIHDCNKVIVRSLSCLTSLELDGKGTNRVTSFPEGSLQNLDALESLEIEFYNELTFFPDELSNLTALKKLRIMSCPALQCLPVMSSSIVEVNIDRCESLKSLSQSMQYLSNLEYLKVCHCDQLELSSEDFQNLISLQTLYVIDLPKLTSFPDLQRFSKLQNLTVERCKNLIRLWPQGTQNLTDLECLALDDCEQLELSSAECQHFIKLQRIYFRRLSKLTSLPELQHLHSLSTLEIWDCKKLKMLPQGMQNLTALKHFRIQRCHFDLYLRCVKDSGEYWHFIKDIPNVSIYE